MDERSTQLPGRLSLLPLRDVVLFPGSNVPLFVGRAKSVAAIQASLAEESLFFAVTQKRPDLADPIGKDLHRVGTIASVREHSHLPDGTMRIVVSSLQRARLSRIVRRRDRLEARVVPAPDAHPGDDIAMLELRSEMLRAFEEYVALRDRLADDVFAHALKIQDPSQLSYFVSGHFASGVVNRQRLLETEGWKERFEALLELLESDVRVLRVERRSRRGVEPPRPEPPPERGRPPTRDVLGDEEDELDELRSQVSGSDMPDPMRTKATKEITRLSRMNPMSPEATVSRTYLEWLLALPWSQRSEDQLDLDEAAAILDEDHHGLDRVKDRILEHIAVMKCSSSLRGPVLCLVGPPGVGKTSLGRSIGRALGREFVRMSLGGVRDEAEIRGHRRTYIGSMPGRVIQGMRRAGTVNPLFLLDEIDKMGTDYRGDPAAALLEVLDPEQNATFQDHYVDGDYDLSNVMFVTTANDMNGIAPPLRDRLEIIRIPGYLEHEKLAIARRYLLPRQLGRCGLTTGDIDIRDDAMLAVIRERTREAGVRNLEREVAALCRKAARRRADKHAKGPLSVDTSDLTGLLGAPRYVSREVVTDERVGVATGLAWTEVGGTILNVEVALLPGGGRLTLTGTLGETMQESGKAALSYIRARSQLFGLDADFAERTDIHIHLPEGGVPKDGPSAGITLALAMVSALTGTPTREDVAMTGEITLRGMVLPVGGLAEKLMAVKRTDVRVVVVPHDNLPQIHDLPVELKEGLEIVPVRNMDEVIEYGLDGPGAVVQGAQPLAQAH